MIRIWKQKTCIYSIAVLISVILSIIAIYQAPIFNPDGVVYLSVAKTYISKGFHYAIGEYNWPFYSCVIAWVSRLTSLSLLHAAYLINIVFSALIVISFMILVEVLSAGEECLWLSAFTILIFQQLNIFRIYLIRDHGYWCFYLLSLISLLKFSEKFEWKWAIFWSVVAFVSVLFRFEGVVFLLALPFCFFAFPIPFCQRFFAFLKLNSVIFVVTLLVLFLSFFIQKDFFQQIIFIKQVLIWKFHSMFIYSKTLFTLRCLALKQALSTEDSVALLINGMVGTYIYSLFTAINLAYLILIIFGIYRKLSFSNFLQKFVLWSYVGVNFFITIGFYIHKLSLSTRYAFPLFLVLLSYVPFSLIALYKEWKQSLFVFSFRNLLFPFVCLLMLGMLVGSVYPFGHKKIFLYDAGMWLKNNTVKTATVYSNSPRLLWFSEREGNSKNYKMYKIFDKKLLFDRAWKGYNYLAVVFQNKDAQDQAKLQKIVGVQPITIFLAKDDTVLIYKLPLKEGKKQ